MEFRLFKDITEEIRDLRYEVFCVEQGISVEEEIEEVESIYDHLCLYEGDELVSYCRLERNEPHIRRVITKKAYRRKGYGTKLIAEAERLYKEKGYGFVFLNSQDTAIPFYESCGYSVYGEPNIDAGIPHHFMRKTI